MKQLHITANRRISEIVIAITLILLHAPRAAAQPSQTRYFAHSTVEDRYGVIAPWYQGLNGQCDFRVRIAAETMKRYPWATTPKTGLPAPAYIYNGCWEIKSDGTISPRTPRDWDNGDLAQRCAYAMHGLIKYYRYTGDPAAIAHISMMNDVVLHHNQTGPEHPWPCFLISVPTRGEPYGKANPRGMIQLDIVGLYGSALVQAYQLTGNKEWLQTARHWADVLAAKRCRTPGAPPWNRYANPGDVIWNDLQTGGVIMLLDFFDELIRVGYTGPGNSIVQARDAGRAYLRDVLLPLWLQEDTWGREYWDWEHQVHGESYSEMVPRHMLSNPLAFPNWRTDGRNIMSLYLQRSCVALNSRGDVYSGAWAYPEGCACCGRSLNYAPMQVGAAFAEYGARADSEWARELARRQFLLATYDCHENGVVEDGMDGGDVVAGGWFQVAHPLPLKYVLDGIAWLPATLGANRENHVVRSSAIVSNVIYDRGRIAYTTFDAPENSVDVLRLAFRPGRITANGRTLKQRPALDGNGYVIEELPNGDCLVSIRHDGRTRVTVEGDDPQQCLPDETLGFTGHWTCPETHGAAARPLHTTADAGAAMSCTFEGNQVRIIGSVDPDGGLADIYLDDVKQLCGIDFWNPNQLRRQVVYYRNGLSNGRHTLRVVALGSGNPLARGARVAIDTVQCSAASGDGGFGAGGGPSGPQRWIFGYPERHEYLDSTGHAWLPATEVVIRSANRSDSVARAWYTAPRRQFVSGTADPALYRYGVHSTNFVAYFTVAPGTYHVRIKLMETRPLEPAKRAMDIAINDQPVVRNLDIAATAANRPSERVFVGSAKDKLWDGMNCAADLVFDGINPKHGVIAVRFTGCNGAEAVVSAIQVGPGPGGQGATPR
ncbi:MAG TPA: malectin domain-containing carbohydrate-binding protein [Candidatus Paceibacterota bacterium]|nr:malectin domain-containing carbohydrate-binding protein [Verrucomicrobiota bacterium]HSA11220.1 malectin domain-containing carbohydrate-binding protein [Candidatus Paceibacterota bacterium]